MWRLGFIFSRLLHPRLGVGPASVTKAALPDGRAGWLARCLSAYHLRLGRWRNHHHRVTDGCELRIRWGGPEVLHTATARGLFGTNPIVPLSANLALRRIHAPLCNRYITLSTAALILLALNLPAHAQKTIHQFTTSPAITGPEEMLLWSPNTAAGATYKTSPQALKAWQNGQLNNFTGGLQSNGSTVTYKTGVWVSGDCLKAADAVGGVADAGSPCGTGGGGGGGTPGGSNLQVQYNNAGAFGGFTFSKDVVVDTTTGQATVQSLNGVSFAASATVNTRDASNINAGTLNAARLPTPTATTLGAVQSFTPLTHQFLTGISVLGVESSAQPAFPDLSGTLAASQCPLPSASTIGCVQSFAAQANKWINSISPSGVSSATQPTFPDIAGNISVNQMNSGSGASSSTFWRGDSQWATPAGSGNVSGPATSTAGDLACFAGTTGTILSDCGPNGIPISIKTSGASPYQILNSDMFSYVVANSASPFSILVPQAGTLGFEARKWVCIANEGAGLVSLSYTTSIVYGALSSASLPQNTGLCLIADANGNYLGQNTHLGMGSEFTLASGTYSLTGGIANSKLVNAAANTWKGNPTGGSTSVSDNAWPSCADSSGNHLNYVSGTGVTCGTSSIGSTGTSGHTIPFLDGNNTFSGSNYFNGALLGKSRTVVAAGAVTVGATDYIICLNKTVGAATTINLPATPATDRLVVVKDCKGDANSNNITTKTTDGTTIDGTAGATGIVFSTAYQSGTFHYNGAEWSRM